MRIEQSMRRDDDSRHFVASRASRSPRRVAHRARRRRVSECRNREHERRPKVEHALHRVLVLAHLAVRVKRHGRMERAARGDRRAVGRLERRALPAPRCGRNRRGGRRDPRRRFFPRSRRGRVSFANAAAVSRGAASSTRAPSGSPRPFLQALRAGSARASTDTGAAPSERAGLAAAGAAASASSASAASRVARRSAPR